MRHVIFHTVTNLINLANTYSLVFWFVKSYEIYRFWLHMFNLFFNVYNRQTRFHPQGFKQESECCIGFPEQI